MKIEKSSEGKFTPHIEGNFRAVCVDVTPLKSRETQYGVKQEFRLVFETDAPTDNTDAPACIWTRGFTPSLNEKAAFRKFLRQWFGRDLTAAEESVFETETLIGRAASLVITHTTGDGDKVYANIAACVPCKDNPLEPSGAFVRKQDREEGEGASARRMAQPSGGTEKNQPVDATQAGSDWTKVKVHVGKHNGVEVRDLDQSAIEALVQKWLPEYKANPKPTADDKRLANALLMAEQAIKQAAY